MRDKIILGVNMMKEEYDFSYVVCNFYVVKFKVKKVIMICFDDEFVDYFKLFFVEIGIFY